MRRWCGVVLVVALLVCCGGSGSGSGAAVAPAHRSLRPLTVVCAPDDAACLARRGGGTRRKDDEEEEEEEGGGGSSSSNRISSSSSSRSEGDARAPVKVGVSATFVHEVMARQRPMIEAMENNYTVPQQNMSYGVIAPMPLRDVRIVALHVRPAPASRLVWSIVNMSLYIPPTNFTVHARPFSCSGVLWITMNDTTIDFTIDLHRHRRNDTLYVTVSSSAVRWGSMQFNHTIDSTMCNVAEDVVEVFVGKINALAERKIREQMASILPLYIASNFSSALAQLPVPALRRPRTSSEYAQVLLGLVPPHRRTPSSDVDSRAGSEGGGGGGDDDDEGGEGDSGGSGDDDSTDDDGDADGMPLPARDVAVALPVDSLNRLVASMIERGDMCYTLPLLPGLTTHALRDVFPAAYAVCPECALELRAEATSAQSVRFRYNARDDDEDNDDDHDTGAASSAAAAPSPSSVVVVLTDVLVGVTLVPPNAAAVTTAATATSASTSVGAKVTRVVSRLLAGVRSPPLADAAALLSSSSSPLSTTTTTTPPLQGQRRWSRGVTVPLVTLALNATLGVAQLRVCDDGQATSSSSGPCDATLAAAAAAANAGTAPPRRHGGGLAWLSYRLQRVRDVKMRVVSSIIGSIDADHTASQMERLANVILVPYMNTFAPLPLPSAMQLYIDITDTTLTLGVNTTIV